jgi:anaphase-promoting complex subunit 11
VSTGGTSDVTSRSSSNIAPTVKATVKSLRFLATWKWDLGTDDDDVCGICRAPFESSCPSCKLPEEFCPPSVGKCKHAYHAHCINKWLEATSNQDTNECPLCRQPWSEQFEVSSSK